MKILLWGRVRNSSVIFLTMFNTENMEQSD